jgi:alanine dehydrogenase
VLVLGADDVVAVLDRGALVEAVAAALAELSAGAASVPPRVAAMVPAADALLAAMPGHLPGAHALGAKLVAMFPGNAGRRLPTHQAAIVLFDPDTGTPEALLDGTVITAERTAAASAVATRHLARPGSAVLAVLGTGVQARAHAMTVPLVCPGLTEIRIAGRDPAKAAALASAVGPPARAVESMAEAMAGADVVCATTHAAEPVVLRRWLAPGTHVCSVGAHPRGGEVDAATVAEALVAVESRASALAPFPAGATELAGAVDPDAVVEVGELVSGTRAGRSDGDQLTLYKSVGVAVEDMAAAALVLAAARAAGRGQEVRL